MEVSHRTKGSAGIEHIIHSNAVWFRKSNFPLILTVNPTRMPSTWMMTDFQDPSNDNSDFFISFDVGPCSDPRKSLYTPNRRQRTREYYGGAGAAAGDHRSHKNRRNRRSHKNLGSRRSRMSRRSRRSLVDKKQASKILGSSESRCLGCHRGVLE